MKAILSLVLLVLSSASAQATTYLCQAKRAYDLQAGELIPYREQVELSSWATVMFDDATGVLKYGHERRETSEAYWVEEKLVVTS